MSLVKDVQSEFVADNSADFQKQAASEAAGYAEGLDFDSIKDRVTSIAPDAVESGASVIGLEEEAEACRNVTQFGATVGAAGGALVGGLLFGFNPIAAALLGIAGAASGGATYGSACTAVTATDRAFRKKSDVYMGVYKTEDGFNTFPLPASVWEDVIGPILSPGFGDAPKVGPGSIRPDVAVAMPVELERLQARQAERQAQASSSSALVAAGLAALVAYKLL